MEDNQVPTQDPIVTLYDNLKDEYELSDFETFKNDLSDPTNISKLHGALVNDGFDMPDLDTFSMDLGVKKKDVAGETLPEVVVTSSNQSTPPSSPISISASASDQSPLPLEGEVVVIDEKEIPSVDAIADVLPDEDKTPDPKSGTTPNPPKLTYKDIESVLEKSNTLRKKVEENNKLGLKAQEMGWGESWKAQVKQDQDAYNVAQEEKKKVLEQYSRELSRPVDVLIENGDYKKFFNKDGVFDEGKAIAYFQKVSEKYGGGTYLQNQWLVNLKSKSQLEIDKPRFNEIVADEIKKSGVDLNQYGKKLFDQLTKDKRATAESLVKERDNQASVIFSDAEGKAKEAAASFDQQVTAINNNIKAGTITYQSAVAQYDQLKKQYDLTLKSLDNGYKDAIRKMNINVNGKFNRIEEEVRRIGSSIEGDQVFQSLPDEAKNKLQQVYVNAGTRLSEEKNAKAKEKDKSASFLPTGLNIIGKGVASGLNKGLADIGEYLNMQGFSGGFVNALRGRATAAEVFAPAQYAWNKDEWLNRALSSASTSIGASAPILLPTIGALVATGGGAAGVVGSALTSFAGESAQLGGEQFKESLTQTGDVEEASKKSEQMMKDNLITLPFYFIGGMGDAMIATGKGLRKAATGVALEQLEEVPTEYIQSYNQAVANGYRKGIGSFIKENPEIAADTFVSTIGQSAAMKGFSKALSPLQKLIPDSTTQMLTDVVSKQGVDFANTLIDKWYENGKISKDVVATLKQDVTKIATKIPKLQEAGVDGDKAKLMSSLSAQSEDLTTRINAEQDPAIKAVYKNQLTTLNKDINDLINGNAPYVVFKVPGGNNDTRVMTAREFNALPAESSADLVKSSDGITVVGDDALNQKLIEQKKQLGNPEDVAPGIYTETVELPEVTVTGVKKTASELSKIESAKPEDFTAAPTAEGYAQNMAAAKESLGADGITVDVYNQEDYDKIAAEGGQFVTNADGTAMGALKPNGEIVSIIKSKENTQKGVAPALLEKMKQLGGLFMDNFDIYLTKQYEKAGFKVVARVPFNEEFAPEGWQNSPLKDKPDVVFMAREDIAPAEEKSFTDYDQAKAYTEGLAKQAAADGKVKLPTQIATEFADNAIAGSMKSGSPMFTVTADAPVDLPNVTVKSPIHKKVIADVNQAAKTLASSGVKFKIYDNADSFATESGQDKDTQGVFVDEDGTVSINLAAIKNSKDWNIAWHEASHPVMNIIRNTNRPLYDKMANGLAKLAAEDKNAAAIVAWSENNYEGKETQVDEAMVESIALMADGTIDFDKVPLGTRQAIIDFINEIAKYLGLDPILSDTSKATFIKKAKEISNALKTGTDISEVVGAENVREYQNNLDTPEIVVAGEMNNNPQARLSETPAIDVYESKETEKLPVRSIEDVYSKFDGKAVAINSDPTRVGELTLPSGKKIFMYGGPAYLSLKDNVDAGVGFATTQPSKVKTWSTYLKSVFGDKDGVTLVTTQAPTSMMANSYSLRYVLDAISTLPKTILKSKEFKDEFFGKDLVLLKDAFGEKGYNDFVNKYKKADLSDSKVIDGMIAEMAYKVGDDNKPASFKARGAFVANLLGGIAPKADIKGVEGDKGYVSKKPTKFIAKQLFDRLGLNQEKLFYEIGEKSLVDLYMNDGKWGMAVAGFETKAGESIDKTGGVKHPLFNAKFPGSDAFLLDGAYEIDKLFAPQDIISSGGNPYTKSAAQMLAGSMYVMGDKAKGEKSFEYKPSPISGTKIQQKKSAVVLAEMESIVKAAKENGTYLKAPNGKATKLNPDQWATVRTNNFKNWFGDWEKDPANASKVVDANGEPRVVFHGTNANFDEFSKDLLGSKNWMADSAQMGFFFAGDKRTSEAYTGMNTMDMAGVAFGAYDDIINKYSDEIKKVKADISSVYDKYRQQDLDRIKKEQSDLVKLVTDKLREKGESEVFISDVIRSMFDSRGDLYDFKNIQKLADEENESNGNSERLKAINDKMFLEIEARWKEKTGANPKIMEIFLSIKNPKVVDYTDVKETNLPRDIQGAIGNRNDGVVFNNLKDGAEADDIFVALEPNQIKSATDNTGEFSKASNKIQQKVGKVELPATTQKQMTEDDKGNYLFYHYSDKNIKKIDPNKFGSNTMATGRDERPGVGISMYYTRPDVKEGNVPSDYGYVVRVPKGKVYPFNQDPLNLIEPAKRMFEKQFPGQAFDTNKQVAWVSKAAAGRGYPMTVAEWNIGRKKLLRAQTTEALKPEVYSKVKPGTLNQVETNPALDKFKPNAKRAQAKIGGGLSVEDLKDFNSLPNVNLAEGNNYVPLSRFGITDLTGENVKTVAEKLAEVEGPYQPIFKAISKMPKADKVEMYNLGQTVNIFNQSGGMVAGLYSPPRTFLDKPVIGIATDIYANQYSATAHEMMHWVTIDSVNKNKGTTEYKALEDIYKFLKAKHPDIVGEKASGAYYGLQNFKEFMAELLTNKDFRDNMAGIMAKDKNEFRETVYGYNQSTSGDIINTLINYVQKVIRDLMDKWGKGIDFNKSMIDNATDLAVKAFFKDQVGGAQLSKGGADIDADTRKSVANMLGKLSDEDVAKILMDEKGLTEEEAMDVIEDVKFDPALNPTVGDIVGEVEEGERARGLSKTFPDRGADTIAKINSDAKKYFVVSNKQTAAESQAFIDEKNPEDALDYLLTQPTDIPNRVRIWMSGAVMDKIDTAINEAQLKGDKETAQRLTEKQAQLVNQVAPLGTELGQAIQAFRRFYENSKGSPSMLQFYIKKITDQVESEKGKPLTDEERKNIVDLAKNVQSANEGLPKDEAVYALGNYVSSITPVAATDIMEAIWYAHILSGITTQSTNFFANLWNTFAEGAVVGTREAIKTKSVMPFLNGIQGFLSGIKQGANDAADIMKTGVGKQDGDKFKQGNILEFFSWKQVVGDKLGKVLDWAPGYSPKVLKYVGRALAATDAAFSRANSEAISRVMAYNIAQEERKQNPDIKINQRVDELLNKTAEKKQEAQDKAKAEGYLEGTTRYRRRVGEIMEAGRSKDLKKEADEFGKRVTLNYEPEGFMRPVYKLALAMQQSTKLTRMFIPFTRIVVNLTENALNYSGAGFVKAAVGSTNTEGGRRKLTADERADFAIKATIGLSTFVLLSGLTGEDDDDLFEITANGTGDPQKNYELMKSGWRPYSIKTKEGRYISYKDWPVAPVLAAVGAMHDNAKYSSSDEPTNEAIIAAAGMVTALYDKSVMKGIQDFVEVIKPKQEYNQASKLGDRLISWGADQAKTMAVSNFTQQAIKFTREAMDSPIKAAKGVERIYRDIPYLNDGLNPILDVFGEPVTPSTSEKLLPITLGKPSKDEVLAAFNENGIYIGKPKTRDLYVSKDPKNEETRPMTDDEYYQYTKRSGQITKQIIMEEWKDISKILAIPDRKKRRAELKDYMSSLIEDARKDALFEFPNQ
jgi:hypothetical protein